MLLNLLRLEERKSEHQNSLANRPFHVRKPLITACVLRSITDLFYAFHIILNFRTGFIVPSSRVYGRGELVEDSSAIAKRYLLSYFIVDVVAVLPLPQIVILIIAPNMNGPISLATTDMLTIVVSAQNVPRFFRIIPLYKEVERTTGFFSGSTWSGGVFYLFLFMWFSNVSSLSINR
ncbi:hypothetical protein MTR67_024311 [Solanum verrucosum]|uniref:Ion transport domain-containing protein n=1 Tax=Solanum verrucosum TaxID=315347 RepID=A0AAF0R2R1_SOLVR|nr:hypothetical protein MTR67_024311 [Solanum verrucosum]